MPDRKEHVTGRECPGREPIAPAPPSRLLFLVRKSLKTRHRVALNGLLCATLLSHTAVAQFSQQGSKLTGTGAVGHAVQGQSVSISADGNTAIVGGPNDFDHTGAAWIFVVPSDLTITTSHTGNFEQGDAGDTYTITVSNAGPRATSGTVTVTDTVPNGLTPSAPNEAFGGWSCSISGQTLTCVDSDVLVSGGSYPDITLTVNVANNAPSSVTNMAAVSGGGETNTTNDTATDPTTINPAPIPGSPAGVTAAAVSSTRVDVAWTTAARATSYQIDRQAAGGGFSPIGMSLSSSFSDTTASPDSAYLYRVRAVNGSGVSSSSPADLATTVIFFDPALVPGILVQAVHLGQLRTAVNAVRLLAGLTAAGFTDDAVAGAAIRGVHLIELRSSLDAARGALGLSTSGYTDAELTGVPIKAIHFQELRDRVQ